jgi:hypothetical protein
MTDQLLGILKIALLALLYLFFARVLWAVWSEVRGPRPGRTVVAQQPGHEPTPYEQSIGMAAPVDATTPTPAPAAKHRARRTQRGSAHKLVVLLPKERRGAAFTISAEITIGRAPHCTISIPDDTFVSQLHARLYRNADRTWVEDLASTNGSYVNGARLDGIRPFDKGDRLQIGATVLEGE